MLEFDATFLIAQLSFIIFMVIMYFILLRPIRAIMKKREGFLGENSHKTQLNLHNAQELEKNKNVQIKEVQKKASSIVTQTSKDLNLEKQNKVNELNKTNQGNLSLKKDDLNLEKETLLKAMGPEVADIAQVIVSKVLNKDVVLSSLNVDEAIKND